ncbi:unnamed protein product [Meloidogyne enterolobii]|uniref:Uncharacterized protein n=1 Tax=Meloidogyne enterolobii TaxID=390850 RepID=A0ACB0ZXP1_MELEN
MSLTFARLEGFDNPAKSGASFFTSWDKKYFLKSVMSEPKWYSKFKKYDLMDFIKFIGNKLEPEVEKDFFFFDEENKNFEKSFEEENKHLLNYQRTPSLYFNENERKFRGGFLEYFDLISSLYSEKKLFFKNKRETLLPKFFLLFSFTPLNGQSKSEIFSIQNGLFPEGTPKIHLIFDLKGSKRILPTAEGLEKLLKNGKSPNWTELNFVNEKGGENGGFFPNGIKLNENDFENFRQMIEEDSKVGF